jgi:hypothetical protein
MPLDPLIAAKVLQERSDKHAKKSPLICGLFLGRVFFDLAAEFGNQLTQTFFRVTK